MGIEIEVTCGCVYFIWLVLWNITWLSKFEVPDPRKRRGKKIK